MTRRAFALPLVLLLSVVGVLAATVMLQRESAQRLTTARQVSAYRAHHLERGIREIIDAWARQTAGLGIERMIAQDGHVMDLRLADGGLLRVYMADGQGSALTETALLPDIDRRDAERVLENLRLAAIEENAGIPDPSWTRTVGPARISVAAAPVPVLRAALRTALDDRRADEVLQAITDARARGPLSNTDLTGAFAKVSMENPERTRLTRLLTTAPDLWDVTIEYHAPERAWRSAGAASRFGGKMRITRPGTTRPSGFEPMGSFLTWEELPTE